MQRCASLFSDELPLPSARRAFDKSEAVEPKNRCATHRAVLQHHLGKRTPPLEQLQLEQQDDPLCKAAREGDAEKVKLLIEAEAHVHTRAQGHAALVDWNIGLLIVVQGVDVPQEFW